MACGLDTRPAALACLRLLIASLNLLIAVSRLLLLRPFVLTTFLLFLRST
jgi:hypothetical protein